MAASLYGPYGEDLSKDQEPTEQSISELIYRARFEFNREDQLDRIRDTTYFGDNQVAHPAHVDFQEAHLLTINDAVANVMGLLSNRPVSHVTENSFKSKNASTAGSVQNFLNSLFPQLEHDIDEATWLKVLEDQVRFGRAYDALEYAPTRWVREPRLEGFKNPDGTYRVDEYDEARTKFGMTARLPLIWRHLPARGCFAWKDDWGIYKFLSIEERAAEDVAHSYNMPELLEELDDMARTPSMHVLFCRFWNRSYYAYWVSKGYSSQTWEQRAQAGLSLLTLADTKGEIVAKGRNPYGVVPVVETLGMPSTDQNPARKHRAIIDPIIPLATYLDQLVSQKGSAIRVYCWPTPYLKNVQKELGASLQQVPVGPDGRPNPLNITPGQILYLPAGQDIGWLVVPQNGPDIDKQIQLIAQACDKKIPSQLFDGSAQQNGYLFNSMVQAAIGKLEPQIENTKRSHRRRCELAFRIIEMHGDTLYSYQYGSDASDPGNWTQVTPKDVEDWKARYNFDIDYKDTHPYDESQDIAAAVQLTTPRVPGGPPLISDRTARIRYLRLPDADKEEEWINIEEIMRGPLVKEVLQAQATIDAGLSIDKIMNQIGKLSPEQLKYIPPTLVQAAQQMGQPIPGANVAMNAPVPGNLPPPAGGPMQQGPPGGMGGSPGVSAAGGTPATPLQANPTGLAAPSTMGGIPGAMAAPKIPGQTAPGTPPAPRLGVRPPKKGK